MSQWNAIRPILVTLYELLDNAPTGIVYGPAIVAALGVGGDGLVRLQRDLRDLEAHGYIEATWSLQSAGPPHMIKGTPSGRQEVQGWPGPRTSTASAELLIALLRAQAEHPDTPTEQKTRLRAILAAIGKGGTDALSKVTAELILRAGGQVT